MLYEAKQVSKAYEYIKTKETCGEYLKSTKEHYFSKRV